MYIKKNIFETFNIKNITFNLKLLKWFYFTFYNFEDSVHIVDILRFSINILRFRSFSATKKNFFNRFQMQHFNI